MSSLRSSPLSECNVTRVLELVQGYLSLAVPADFAGVPTNFL